MIYIQKHPSLPALDQYQREQKQALIEGRTKLLDEFADKDTLRHQLAEEQGYLCAYCMNRIRPENNNTKIEHFHSQTQFPSEQLDYKNLLLCSDGNEGKPRNEQHCDTHKGNQSLKYNPSKIKEIEQKIQYKHDGTITSTDDEWEIQLNKVLNLNLPRLKNERKAALLAVERKLSSKPNTRTKSEIQSFIEIWEKRNSFNELKPFCGIVLYRLKKHPSYTK